MKQLLLFQGYNSYTKASQCYIYSHIACLPTFHQAPNLWRLYLRGKQQLLLNKDSLSHAVNFYVTKAEACSFGIDKNRIR
jgi:hypothetical protein